MGLSAAERAAGKERVGHYRVSEEVYQRLEAEARANNMSLNAHVSQLLSNHALDELLFKEVGSVRMTRDAVRKLLELMPEDELVEWSRGLIDTGPDSMMFAMNGDINLASVLDVLRLFSRSGWYSIHETKAGGKDTIIMLHDLGPKFSLQLCASVVPLFERIGLQPKVTATDTSVMLEW